MTSANLDNISGQLDASMRAEYFQSQWYAAYTSAHHEKHVVKQLDLRYVEHFLPLYGSVRRWKDRRVKLDMPLFPGYVFVRIALRDRLKVLQVPGVARLVGFNGTPTPLPENEINLLKKELDCGVRVEPHPYVNVGQKVRVRSGPLQGLEGILVKRKNRSRLIMSVELIMRSVAVELDDGDLEPIWTEVPAMSSRTAGRPYTPSE
jgi:transcription antitermination factor NusG